MGYYLYLPVQFIYHDLRHLSFIPDILHEYGPTGSFYQATALPGDVLKVYALCTEGSPCLIDDLRAELFRPKP